MTKDQKRARANKYLIQIRNADKEITEMILKISYLKYKASGCGAIRYDKDRVMTSPQDMMCEAVTEAVYLEKRMAARHRELMDARRHTEDILELWGDKQARFIDIYYLNHGNMSDVARQMKCSDRTAYRIRLDALERFADFV